MAELRFLQNRYDASVAYWTECRDTFFALFMNGSQSVLINKNTPGVGHTMVMRFISCMCQYHV